MSAADMRRQRWVRPGDLSGWWVALLLSVLLALSDWAATRAVVRAHNAEADVARLEAQVPRLTPPPYVPVGLDGPGQLGTIPLLGDAFMRAHGLVPVPVVYSCGDKNP